MASGKSASERRSQDRTPASFEGRARKKVRSAESREIDPRPIPDPGLAGAPLLLSAATRPWLTPQQSRRPTGPR